jgi:hypothetical protein
MVARNVLRSQRDDDHVWIPHGIDESEHGKNELVTIYFRLHLWGNSLGLNPPNFVYMIVFIYFFMFNIFAVNMVLQYKGVGRWRDYLYGERAYIILSFVAKSVLAWLVFIGVFSPF